MNEEKVIVEDQVKLNVSKLIDSFTQEERWRLFSDLTKRIVGPVDFEFDAGMSFLPVCYTYDGGIPSKMVNPVMVTCHEEFIPERLVILEPVEEVIETEVQKTFATEIVEIVSGPFWNRKREEKPVEVYTRTDHIQHRSKRFVDRGVWTVSSVFVGVQAMFRTQGSINGSAFGPGNNLAFDKTVMRSGTSITLSVEHSLDRRVPFYGVILGRSPNKKKIENFITPNFRTDSVNDSVLDGIRMMTSDFEITMRCVKCGVNSVILPMRDIIDAGIELHSKGVVSEALMNVEARFANVMPEVMGHVCQKMKEFSA